MGEGSGEAAGPGARRRAREATTGREEEAKAVGRQTAQLENFRG